MAERTMVRLPNLRLQLADDFSAAVLDPAQWTTEVGWVHGAVSTGGGVARIKASTEAPPGPGVMAYSGFASSRRMFTPGLAGTNLLEVTLVDYTHTGEYVNQGLTSDGAPSDRDDPHQGAYIMGFCLAIGTFRGLVGSEPDRDVGCPTHRAVQIHFDWWSKAGLWFALNRNIVPGDHEKYRLWDPEKDPADMRERRAVDCPVLTLPGNSLALALPYDPLGDNHPCGHRYGLLLTDDGNVLSWTLDGEVMDTADISGFFGSSPGCVAEGAYASIVGGGSYRGNEWTAADVTIFAGR